MNRHTSLVVLAAAVLFACADDPVLPSFIDSDAGVGAEVDADTGPDAVPDVVATGPLAIVQVSPAQDAPEVSLFAEITVAFNNPLDADGQPADVLSVVAEVDGTTEPVAGMVMVTGQAENELVFRADPHLPLGSRVTATLSGPVDIGGGTIEDISWSFDVDPRGLFVASTVPADGGTLSDLDSPVVIEFSTELDPASVNVDTVSVTWTGPAGAPVLEVDGSTLRVWPPGRRWREFGRTARIDFYDGLRSIDGLPLTEPEGFDFFTLVLDPGSAYRVYLEGREDYALSIGSDVQVLAVSDDTTAIVPTLVEGAYRLQSLASQADDGFLVTTSSRGVGVESSAVGAESVWTPEQYGTGGNLLRNNRDYEASPDVYLLKNADWGPDDRLRAPWDGSYQLIIDAEVGQNVSWWFERIE